MPANYQYRTFPSSRTATFDVFSVGMKKHHICALLEFDVTDARKVLKKLKAEGRKVSFTAWILKMIGRALTDFPEASSYLYNKKKLIIFEDINISLLVEKNIAGQKVPIPLVIKKVNEKTVFDIFLEIETAKKQDMSESEMVLQKKASFSEKLYQHLPGIIRRAFWGYMLSHPRTAFRNMGNVAVTSPGMAGRIMAGSFTPPSIHCLLVLAR
jgi:chloramphenicol O-acetyltransferase